MPAGILRTLSIAVVAVCFSDGAFAAAHGRPRNAPASTQGSATSSRSADTLKAPLRAKRLKQNAARTLAADRDPYADPAAPYKADRLSPPLATQPILDIPGQTTVLTRQVLDDMNATTLRDAMGSTAGVTVGR
jgi:outer membrane receptor for monomeric catechols